MCQLVGREELHSAVFKRVWQTENFLVLSGLEIITSVLTVNVPLILKLREVILLF
jgi:hypothetical protein